MAETTTKRKRIKLTVGDVFELSVPDGRFGYGIVVKRGGLKNGATPYIAIFHSIHDQRPDLSTLDRDAVALAGWTTDALVYHGRWSVIAHDRPLPIIPFPNFKIDIEGTFCVTDVDGEVIDDATPAEQDLLDNQFSRAPIAFQNAFESLHGFRDWQVSDEELTPVYARARITRPMV